MDETSPVRYGNGVPDGQVLDEELEGMEDISDGRHMCYMGSCLTLEILSNPRDIISNE
jgi:hypothetical protein